jgi:hypothetical protein
MTDDERRTNRDDQEDGPVFTMGTVTVGHRDESEDRRLEQALEESEEAHEQPESA